MSLNSPFSKHYQNPKVLEEIVRFAKGRWVGLHCSEKDSKGRPLLIRYIGRSGHPLRVDGASDVARLLERFEQLGPRTVYATANVYRHLDIIEDVVDYSNIVACTPTWDVDNKLEGWRTTVAVVKEVVAFLEDNGIAHSVFVKWSGRGCHVHVHHNAISAELARRVNPLDLAYAIVEYSNAKLHEKYADIQVKTGSETLKVDNEMDPQRLFSCPLTLHKELDMVCVCISPNDLDRFTLDWASLSGFRHYWGWDEFEIGEADALATKAYEAVGPRPYVTKPRLRRHLPLDEQIKRFM